MNGLNYLAPVDAALEYEAVLEFEAVGLKTIIALMERRRRTNLVFLDACRDNPLARNLARNMGTRSTAIGRGLARVQTGVGTLIAYATQPGNVALDGKGRNSPFTAAFLRHARTPGLEIEVLMRRVRLQVIGATGGAQVPWNHSSLTAPFVFKARAEPVSEAPETSREPAKPRVDRKAMDLAFRTSIRSSRNLALFEEYLRRYPKGEFSFIAKERIKELKAPKRQASAAAVRDTEKGTKGAGLQDAPAPQGEPKKSATLAPPELALALQTELKRVGCDPGKLDGIWGRKGRNALVRFNRHASRRLPIDRPTRDAVDAVKAEPSRVCPLACGAGFEQKGGACVRRSCPAGQRLTGAGLCAKVAIRKERNARKPVKLPKAPVRKSKPRKATKKRCDDACVRRRICASRPTSMSCKTGVIINPEVWR